LKNGRAFAPPRASRITTMIIPRFARTSKRLNQRFDQNDLESIDVDTLRSP
jgi:hypothetical protein